MFLLFCVLRLPGTGGVSLWLRMGEEIEVWAWELEKWPLYKSIQNAFFIVVCDNSATKRAFIITKATKWFSRQTEKVDTILVTKLRQMFWFSVLYKQREILNHSPSLKRGRINTFVFVFCLLIVTTIILQLCCDNKRSQGQIKPHINTNPCHKATILCKIFIMYICSQF